jgi:hypothetical protein
MNHHKDRFGYILSLEVRQKPTKQTYEFPRSPNSTRRALNDEIFYFGWKNSDL